MSQPSQHEVKKHFWEMVRDGITHEDGLIHQRLTILLTVHGFLFAAFFALQTTALSGNMSRSAVVVTQVFLIVIGGFAIWFCMLIRYSVIYAHTQIDRLKLWWRKKYETEAPEDRSHLEQIGTDFPPVLGEFDVKLGLHASSVPSVLLTLNLLLIGVCAFLITVPSLTGRVPSRSAASSPAPPQSASASTAESSNLIGFQRVQGPPRDQSKHNLPKTAAHRYK